MRQEEIFEILSKIHKNPALWLSNLFYFSGQQLSTFACGCEVLLLHGVTPEQVRWTIEQNIKVVEFLVKGHYDKALWMARALTSEAIGNVVESHNSVAHKLAS
ncbi:MAG: hypothetical protein WBV50_12000 [Candidatus Acidiferrum sp.]